MEVGGVGDQGYGVGPSVQPPQRGHESVTREKWCDRPSQSSLLSRSSAVASTLVLGHYRLPRVSALDTQWVWVRVS